MIYIYNYIYIYTHMYSRRGGVRYPWLKMFQKDPLYFEWSPNSSRFFHTLYIIYTNIPAPKGYTWNISESPSAQASPRAGAMQLARRSPDRRRSDRWCNRWRPPGGWSRQHPATNDGFTAAMWCPPSDVCWFIIPINYRYNPHKP